jgi:hypothetical protein
MRLLLMGNLRSGYRAVWLPDLPDMRISWHKSEQVRARIAADVDREYRCGTITLDISEQTTARLPRLTWHITRVLGGVPTKTMPTMKVEQVK